ncbi:MAG: ATP-binding cassette domain-containing protein, partial [Eubacteriales bacterium]|nr:ATP-binding cassette domain-containing protein [Eubacteriales bacterium]
GGLTNGEVGYLPQHPYAFDLSVQKNVELALSGEKEKAKLAQAALERVGLLHLAKARANRLSGGETQRMALARVLARPRKLLLLDEPTASVDIQAIDQIERAIQDYVQQTNCTLIFSTHMPSQAMRLSTRVLALDGGNIGEFGETRQVLQEPQAESTQAFLKNWKL